MRKLIVGLVIAGAVVGLKFYNKGSAHDEVKARLVAICETDTECKAAVEAHFDACFEESYKMGGRRSASHLETQQMVQCLNRRGGAEYFSVNEKEK